MSETNEAWGAYADGQGCDQAMLAVEHVGRRPAYAATAERTTAFMSAHYDMRTGLAVVLLVDCGYGASVTNSACELLPFIQAHHIGRRGIPWENVKWLYRDSMGAWDEIVPLGEWNPRAVAVDFRPLGERTLGDVLAQVAARGMPLAEADVAAIRRWCAAGISAKGEAA